jgi:hypothetical protein
MLGMILWVGIHGPEVERCGKNVGRCEIPRKVLGQSSQERKEQNSFSALLAVISALFQVTFSHLARFIKCTARFDQFRAL